MEKHPALRWGAPGSHRLPCDIEIHDEALSDINPHDYPEAFSTQSLASTASGAGEHDKNTSAKLQSHLLVVYYLNLLY